MKPTRIGYARIAALAFLVGSACGALASAMSASQMLQSNLGPLSGLVNMQSITCSFLFYSLLLGVPAALIFSGIVYQLFREPDASSQASRPRPFSEIR